MKTRTEPDEGLGRIKVNEETVTKCGLGNWDKELNYENRSEPDEGWVDNNETRKSIERINIKDVKKRQTAKKNPFSRSY